MCAVGCVAGVDLQDEGEHQTEDGQRLGQGEAQDGNRLQHAAGLGLTGDAVDVGGKDQADADTGPDGGEAVPEDGDVSGHDVILFRSWCPARHVTERKSVCECIWCECIWCECMYQCSSTREPAMYVAASNVKMYACRNSMRISKMVSTKAMTYETAPATLRPIPPLMIMY